MSFKNLFVRSILATLSLLGAADALAARTTTYYHTNGLGSVVAATNEAGQVLWRKDYAPFGEQLEGSNASERVAYTGKQHDELIGLTNFGARQFDPEIGRFLNVDPVGFVEDNPMSFNRYLYVNNNPYKYVDPDGEFLNFAAKFVLDVGINIAVNYLTTGELNVGGALKESALGVLNPAKTVAKAGKLAMAMKKADKVTPDAAGFAAKTGPTAGSKVTTKRRNEILARDQKKDGSWECATCGQKTNNKSNVHTGHKKARADGGDLSDRNLHCQGAACNLSGGRSGVPKPGMSCKERGSCGAPYGRKD